MILSTLTLKIVTARVVDGDTQQDGTLESRILEMIRQSVNSNELLEIAVVDQRVTGTVNQHGMFVDTRPQLPASTLPVIDVAPVSVPDATGHSDRNFGRPSQHIIDHQRDRANF